MFGTILFLFSLMLTLVLSKAFIKIIDGRLHFIFILFLFLEQLGLGFISHAVTSVTS